MNIKDIEPTKGHVLVELHETEREVGGVVLAGNQQNSAPVRGNILRTSDQGSPFTVGEHIFFRKYAIDELKFMENGAVEEVVYLIDEREILGVVRPPVEPVERVSEEEARAASKDADEALRGAVGGKNKPVDYGRQT